VHVWTTWQFLFVRFCEQYILGVFLPFPCANRITQHNNNIDE